MTDPTIKSQIARALKHFTDVYCESSDMSKLKPLVRMLNSGLGIIIYFVMFFINSNEKQTITDHFHEIMNFILFDILPSMAAVNLIAWLMPVMFFVVIFSFVIGNSFENGTRMRFFLIGFFMSALLTKTVSI